LQYGIRIISQQLFLQVIYQIFISDSILPTSISLTYSSLPILLYSQNHEALQNMEIDPA